MSAAAGRLPMKLVLALAGAMAMETVGGLVWAGAAAERLNQLERQAATNASAAVRLSRLEAQIEDARRALDRIEGRLSAAVCAD
ncbi:MAG: hypothetical protein ACFB2Z_02720 [Maricaulaceae bacterium]